MRKWYNRMTILLLGLTFMFCLKTYALVPVVKELPANPVYGNSLSLENHFVTVWTGYGIDHMNINVVTAMINEVNLEAGDEIAVFDGSLCVGMVKLTQPISISNPLSFGLIKASKTEDGLSNGFTPGHPIIFKIWDAGSQKELTANTVRFLNPANGEIMNPLPYTIAGTAYVTVNWVNNAPVSNAGADKSVNERTLCTLEGGASGDPDGDPITYRWTAPAGIALSSTTVANPTFTAPEVTSNTGYTFTLVVNDGTVDSSPDQVVITVVQVNRAPVANAGTDKSGNEGSLITLNGSASYDPDGDPVTYLWTAPAGITLSSPSSVNPTFIAPEVSANTDFTFSLVVNDGQVNSSPDPMVVTVIHVNKPPVSNAGADKSVNERTLCTLEGGGSGDPDGDPITWRWTAPAGIVLSSATVANPTFTAPEVTSNTGYTFTLVVNDGSVDSGPDQVVITVVQVNRAPVANAGTDKSGNEGSLITLNGSASSDPDGDPVTYLWTAPAGITLSSPSSVSPTFIAPEVSANTDFTFSLVVNDGQVNSSPDPIVVTIIQVNKPPVANAGNDQTVNEGSSATLNGSGSNDPDGDGLTFLWTAPAGITLNSNTIANPVFTAPAVTKDTQLPFSLIVNDGKVNSAADSIIVTVKLIPKHFKTIWTGNGTDHMQINIVTAKLDDVDLEAGDEIGIYDGTLCVGAGILTGVLSSSNVLVIITSADDGTGNGFIDGHSIDFRVYDKSTDTEVSRATASFLINPNWNSTGKFASGTTAFADINALTLVIQSIPLNAGWNLFSVNTLPPNPDMKAIFQKLIDSGCLIKVQDETGNSLENWGIFGGWVNNIGNISVNEGYKVKLTGNCTLDLEGLPLSYPVIIPLNAGWNILGFPNDAEADGMSVVQQLINRGTLIKVQDEMGNSIENWGVFGGWVNNIGNFKPGEGYKIKVSANEVLEIYESYPKSGALVLPKANLSHFTPVTRGNGVDHMNLNLVGLSSGEFQTGDEIGIFDGNHCVGAVSLLLKHMENHTVSIPLTAADGMGDNGFTEGGGFTVKIWKAMTNTEFPVEPEILSGSSTFRKQETSMVSLERFEVTGARDLIFPGENDVQVYPNPTGGRIYINVKNLSVQGLTLQVINPVGQTMINRSMETNLAEIDLSGKASGIYYLKITGGSWSKTEKIMLR